MILGMSIDTFLTIHVVLSLIGIATGLVVLFEMIRGRDLGIWTAAFLVTTILTSVTGFPLPPYGLDPPRIFGIVSLVLLALAVAGLYAFRLRGSWRWIYVVTAMMALYLNCFVAVTQTFQKVPFFNALAPTQTEAPFAIAQLALLVAFIALGFVSVRKFRPTPAAAALGAH
jgi:hypothetical protein